MTLTIKFIGALRYLSGKKQFTLNFNGSASLKELLSKLSQEMPRLEKALIDQQLGNSRSNSLILINGKEISVLNGLETKLDDGDEVVFVPVVHGG
jgi:molybdopterin synthase sulfur carrier subunit